MGSGAVIEMALVGNVIIAVSPLSSVTVLFVKFLQEINHDSVRCKLCGFSFI